MMGVLGLEVYKPFKNNIGTIYVEQRARGLMHKIPRLIAGGYNRVGFGCWGKSCGEGQERGI